MAQYELNNQLKAIIRNHDLTEIKNLSLDDATDKFLLSLPTNVSIDASDFQGGGSPRPGVEIDYFPAKVANQMLNCFMVIKTGGLSIVPRRKLVKVSQSPVGIDTKWAD